MILVIDNYDSFTYNLVQYLGQCGAEVVVRRNDEITLEEIEALKPDGIMLSPGPCTPNESGVCLRSLEAFLSSERGPRNSEVGAEISELGARSPELGVGNSELGARNSELGVGSRDAGV